MMIKKKKKKDILYFENSFCNLIFFLWNCDKQPFKIGVINIKTTK